MKKFLSLFAAVLFAGSMMAVTLDPSTQTPQTTETDINLTINGVSIAYHGTLNATTENNGQTYPADFRVYGSNTLKLSASSNITKVVIAGTTNKAGFTCSADNGSVTTGASYSEKEEKATLEDPFVVVEDINSKSVTLTVGKQLRAYKIEVTLAEGGEGGEGGETGEGGEGGEGGETGETVELDVVYSSVGYYEQSGTNLWQVNLYKDYDEETETTTYPDLYIGIPAANKQAIAGTYAADDILFIELDTDDDTELECTATSSFVITRQDNGDYRYQITFADEEGTIYRVDVIAPTEAYDGTDETYPDITLDETAGEGGEGGEGGEEIGDVITCAKAAELALAGNTSEVTIEGYVTGIVEEWSSYKNVSFWMADTKDGGQVFEAFRVVCETADEAPAIGDKVRVTGKLTKYTKNNVTIAETEKGGSFEIIEKGDGGDDPVDPQPGQITTCAAAAEAALSVSDNNVEYNNGAEYTIQGYVTSIKTAWSSQHKNISFWMADTKDGGEVLQAYRAACETAANAPKVGDKVKVTGKLTKFGTTPEFAAGCTFVIVEASGADPINLGEKTIAEFLSQKNKVDTCVLTGTVKNIKMDSQDATKYNAYGNFDLEDETGSVYIYGLLTAAGESKQFNEMGIDAGDIITLKGVYAEYNNAPQVQNAVFVKLVKKGTAVDNVTVDGKAVKVIENGSLIILKNGVRFNVIGQVVR